MTAASSLRRAPGAAGVMIFNNSFEVRNCERRSYASSASAAGDL
jgi:hypothetical protein